MERWLTTTEEERMKENGMTPETRQQTIDKLRYFEEQMTDAQLRLLAAFASGMFRKG